MRNVYTINQFELVHNELHFILNEKKQLNQIQATGQVIVDSDHDVFLYIIEENNTYSYISFSVVNWPQLQQMILFEQKPLLRLEDGLMELTNFVEELTMLLFNIEGNANYGDAFVTAVEQTFAEFFSQQ